MKKIMELTGDYEYVTCQNSCHKLACMQYTYVVSSYSKW